MKVNDNNCRFCINYANAFGEECVFSVSGLVADDGDINFLVDKFEKFLHCAGFDGVAIEYYFKDEISEVHDSED